MKGVTVSLENNQYGMKVVTVTIENNMYGMKGITVTIWNNQYGMKRVTLKKEQSVRDERSYSNNLVQSVWKKEVRVTM